MVSSNFLNLLDFINKYNYSFSWPLETESGKPTSSLFVYTGSTCRDACTVADYKYSTKAIHDNICGHPHTNTLY